MKFLSRLFGARRNTNLTTVLERQRLRNTMPGQTAAMAAVAPRRHRLSDERPRRTSCRSS